ncbi:hypothetical protein ABB37_05371 [Leptomonas pyrrhocoris]|uniref:Uncharacterized protein n=1 Tax=Leptomonas pyrrhocoris TaxID=157538 RepID=A0A0M9FZZ2_LEPPY|nr:hypothetical protein ABB37_05371 [Leptomonas pyrrhocoris]KPA79555.1 hypothetical protein ABB37_05371 [Leptomonas pyrrhocoris]|eukprot:XP_015657994.1 hypothetical protein ABB37_05371 [Leptomonas pyrrhocoris]
MQVQNGDVWLSLSLSLVEVFLVFDLLSQIVVEEFLAVVVVVLLSYRLDATINCLLRVTTARVLICAFNLVCVCVCVCV